MEKKKIYKFEELKEIEVEGDFVCQYLNGGQGYTVYYNGEDYPEGEYTTSNNYDFIMGLYEYFDLNKNEFTVDSDELEKTFWELEKKYNPVNLHDCVADPDWEGDFLDSTW